MRLPGAVENRERPRWTGHCTTGAKVDDLQDHLCGFEVRKERQLELCLNWSYAQEHSGNGTGPPHRYAGRL